MNGIYWGLTALCVMGKQDALPRDEMVDFVMSCWDDEAGMYHARSPDFHPTNVQKVHLVRILDTMVICCRP